MILLLIFLQFLTLNNVIENSGDLNFDSDLRSHLFSTLVTGAHDVCVRAVNVKASFDQRSFVSAEFCSAREMQ